jgi:hypothetical protein
MKYSLLLLLFLLAYVGAAQPGPRELEAFYDQLNAYPMAKYRPERGYQLLLLRSNFSEEDLTALRLKGKQLVRVDMVYTAFRLDPGFSQRQLNLSRLRNLAARLPGILENEALSWHLVEQTGCNSPGQCQDFFHGFVLYIEKSYSAADTRREADSLTRVLDIRLRKLDKVRAARKNRGKPIACDYPPSRYPLKEVSKRLKRAYAYKDKQARMVEFRAEVDKTGQVERMDITTKAELPCRDELARALRASFAFANGFRVGKQRFAFAMTGRVQLPLHRKGLHVSGYFLADSLVKKHRIRLYSDDCVARLLKPDELLDDEPLPNPDAGTVSKVMSRHPDWNKRVVVADVTGSMAPYTLDLLTWLQLSTLQEEKTFVFFNDGNDAPDNKKIVGSTGGLYDVKTNDFARIREKVLEAMLAGGGGDAPENDGEAVRHALQLAPDATEIILLADNHTFPRDPHLLTNTKAKVRIVLCGATGFINPKYLTLARHYGVTLHTLETDLTTLSTMLEGETINIQGAQYLVTKDGFRLVKVL